MTNTLVKILNSPDGKYRLRIEMRPDGLFQYLEEEYRLIDEEYDLWDWDSWHRPHSGLFGSFQDAENEARTNIGWLKE